MWKTALKAVFHKFYLVHSWIPWPRWHWLLVITRQHRRNHKDRLIPQILFGTFLNTLTHLILNVTLSQTYSEPCQRSMMERLRKQLAPIGCKYLTGFFNWYLAAPRPTLGHYRGDSLTHPMLIIASYIFDPKVTGSLVTRLDP